MDRDQFERSRSILLRKRVSRSFKTEDVGSLLTSVTGYFEQTVPRYLLYEFKHHFRTTKSTFQILSGNELSLRVVNSQNIHLTCEAATDLL